MSETDIHDEDCLLYVLGILEGLIDKGYMTGPKIITLKGAERLAVLKAEGFKVTKEEMEQVISGLKSIGFVKVGAGTAGHTEEG